jgi:hypothetical protein
MPEYKFDRPDGTSVLEYYRMADAPPLGEEVEIDGILCTRSLGRLQIDTKKETHIVGHSLPRNHPDAPRVDSSGRPCFTTRQEVADFVAKTSDRPGGGFDYDG